jgi:chorismate mutase-like protein
VIDDPEITRLRDRIDQIDHEILSLLAERLNVVHQVGQEKLRKGYSVFDPKREEKLLSRLIESAPAVFDERSVRTIFSAIVSESRRLEDDQINQSSSPEWES